MKIGAMNNPHGNLYKELEWIGKTGFDFVDFTVEPERNMPCEIDVARAKRIMKKYDLGIVGHMGDWMLPVDSGYESLREACKKELISALRILKRLGAKHVTIHSPRVNLPVYALSRKRYFDFVKAALSEARKLGITVMLENNSDYLEKKENTALFHEMLRSFPALKLHIDVGHTNVGVKTNDVHKLMARYGKRVKHFHFSDNHGNDDEHFKLGAGTIDWRKVIKLLKKHKYDGTITVEVFRSGKAGEKESLHKLRKWWAMN